jgi:hypothetical protein
MSDDFGSYGYLSWLRRGVATGLTTPDGAAPLGQPRVALAMQVSVAGAPPGDGPVAVSGLALYGPGDVTGFDARAVARTWPQPDTGDAEPNYFPLIEVVPADLPWMYTPAAPEPGHGRLRPWFCLIALRDDEYQLDRGPNGAPYVRVNANAPLPLLTQAWAWAHVQVAGHKSLDGSSATDLATLQDLLVNSPETLVPRLLCPRRLDARTHYTAFVVPTFLRGVQAGLGQPPADSVDGLAPAWADSDAPSRAGTLDLPVYHSWGFSTGDFGDFLYLVRQLRHNPLPPTVGVRPMDVSNPGGLLPGAAPGSGNVLGLEAALKAPNAGTAWADADRRAWTRALVSLLQAASPVQVALPLYGRWHAGRTGLNANPNLAQPLPWFDDLNTDPRLRVAAGLGVAVVQAQQQQLMAAAWQQAAGIVQVNAELRQAQLGQEASDRLYRRHLLPLAPQQALLVSAPVHARIAYTTVDCATNARATRTVAAWLAHSPAPRGFFDPQWRRACRAWGGPLGRRAGGPSPPQAGSLLDRLMDGTVAPAAGPLAPTGINSMAAAGIDGASLTRALTPPPRGPSTASPTDYYLTKDGTVPPPSPPAISENDGTTWGAFGQAATALAGALSATPPPAVPLCPVDSAALSTAVLTALDPRTTVPAAVVPRLRLAANAWQGSDPLGPVFFAPTFPQPAVEPLLRLSQDWVLPGLDQVPPNTVSLLEANDRFIEAYMVGLNFELGRELLWNGFPTDQRGSYFRQFWDHSTALTASGQVPPADARPDIDEITHWTNPLGQNPNPHGLPAGGLFLLIRGDLFRRYPNALVYATRAVFDNANKPAFPDTDAPQEMYPVFSGVLRPDVSFFAFGLTDVQARGHPGRPNSPADPGWYFVLQEHAAEARFGLEAPLPSGYGQPVSDWSHVSWGSLAADAAALARIAYIDLNAALPDTTGAHNPGDPSTTGLAWHAGQETDPTGSRAADLAYVTLRDPTRVAIHASALLPP